MKQRKIRYIIKGIGNKCPKCEENMERRGHKSRPDKTWFYTEWDYCKPCGHLQHYDKFKSSSWVESEQQENFFKEMRLF